jgi:hypothetical protein
MIMREAGKNRIEEIEEIISGRGKIYEAGWISKGWETEILLTMDGKLLRKKMERILDDDDDDDDDEDDDDDDDGEEDD